MAKRWLLVVLGSALLAHAALFLPLPMLAQAVAALAVAGAIPGCLLVAALVGRSAARPDPFEWALYSGGAAYAVMVVVMLLVSYLPGGPTRWQTLLAFDAVSLLLLGWLWLETRRAQPASEASRPVRLETAPTTQSPISNLQSLAFSRWLWAGLIALLAVGAILRFTGLGYADYQGDEARAALRAAAVLQGYEDVLFLHKKGPTEILLPTVIYALTGHLTEATARLPFALANFLGLFATFALGARLFNPLAGWVAAMFLALDGYFIGFAHIVQYQSVVFYTSMLTVLVLHRVLTRPVAPARWLSLAALFLATALLSHYEGALAALPAAYLLGVLAWRNRAQWRAILGATLVAAAVGGGVLALFYAPYILNERFAATYTYLTARRIGGSPPYNNLADVFLRTTLYSTTYAVLLLIALTVLAILRLLRANFSRALAWALSLAVIAFTLLTLFRPGWLTIGGRDWIAVPFTLLFALIILLPRQRHEERAVWLWFGAVMILALFLIEKPRTHVYTFFMPWALLAGSEASLLWRALRERTSFRTAAPAGSAAAALLILAFGYYAFAYFLDRGEVMLNYAERRPPGYWVVYDEPDDKARFGFPLNNGWKVVGELYRTGAISGSFETNEKEAWVPAWYTRGADRCRREANWYFEIRNLEPWGAEDELAMEHYLREGFEKWGRVQVGGRDKMVIYQRTGAQQEFPTQAPNAGLTTFPLEDFAAAFDANAAPGLPLTYPSVDPPIANPLDVNFGDTVTLEGYAIEYEKPLRPGDSIYLTLYWRGQKPIDKSFKVFNQAFYGDGQVVAQRDGYPVCEGRETWRWDPGELITDPYVIPVAADAPDGLYPLYTGLYLEESLERLPILNPDGTEAGTQYHLTDIRIGEEP